uniref:Putative zinc knuckle CX2CX4HX4C n=1 Tax=Tanacetum cinerariifolium TaxID=118510 RepID=A0A6L2KFN6_TANCI|nr:putative zinc knuckle CX2CX4HX4C [Tanacetum cinerariifolium]
MKSWGRSSYARAMIELRADVELKDTIVVVVSKLVGDGFLCTLYILSMSENLPETVVEDPNDDDDFVDYGLTGTALQFAIVFDINLLG